jgi:hypothetical protein
MHKQIKSKFKEKNDQSIYDPNKIRKVHEKIKGEIAQRSVFLIATGGKSPNPKVSMSP